MKANFLWAAALCLLAGICHAQSPDNTPKFTISGYIKDAGSGEELLYANVLDVNTGVGATSNAYGFYSLTLPAGEYELSFSYIGYQPTQKIINLQGDQELNVELDSEGEVLQEVVVSGKRANEAVEQVAMSRIDVPITDIKKLPALFGEPDVIKAIQMLPGVASAGEGTSSFYVRGGGADQNLVLIDEAPVYDVSHLFGIFSVFNADVIKSAELYKGGIPAKYGGRLSSLLEITTKDGNAKEFHGTGSIGLMAAKLMLEGPIAQDKASFIVSGRRSYVDIFTPLFEDVDAKVSFNDINAKINWKPNNKNRVFLAAYTGRDNWKFEDNFSMDWGNTTATMRWNHLFSERLFSNLSLVYSKFDYELESTETIEGFAWMADQEEFSLKEDLSFFISPKLSVKAGYQGIYRKFNPGVIAPNSDESIFSRTTMQEQFALDHGLYLGIEQQISPRLSIDYGLRYTIFQNIGKGTVYEYEDLQNSSEINIVDSTSYKSFEVIRSFSNPEPRFAARYKLNDESSVKLSYNRMVQYIHLMSNSTVPIPFNTWAPSSTYLDPQKADQVAAGYFRNFQDNMFEFSAEVYYKKSTGLTGFADNAQVFFNEHLATEYRQGDGESYGLELYLRKTRGPLQGFMSYTLSKATMQADGINAGKSYTANHDRRHNLNMALTYELDDRWNFGANFTYTTGRPITLPTGKFEFDGYQANYFSERNGYRLPDFHRLDLSFNHTPAKNQNKRFKSSYSFGVYNAYNNQNPFTIYTRTKQDDDGNIIGDGTEKEARMVYLFGALPYFNWTFTF